MYNDRYQNIVNIVHFLLNNVQTLKCKAIMFICINPLFQSDTPHVLSCHHSPTNKLQKLQ